MIGQTRKQLMSDTTTLRIDGEVENAIDISYDELAAFDVEVQVPDVSRFQANRKGDGVTLESLWNAFVRRSQRPISRCMRLSTTSQPAFRWKRCEAKESSFTELTTSR